MRAELVDQADAALGVAEGDQLLAHQLDPHRRAVRLGQFRRQQERRPIAAQQFAHQRAGADAAELVVLFTRHHGDVSSDVCYSSRAIIGSSRRRERRTMGLPRIAIATGDPAGIGPEIALKAALDARVHSALPAACWWAIRRRSRCMPKPPVCRRGFMSSPKPATPSWSNGARQPARCRRRNQYAGRTSARSMPLTAAPRSPRPPRHQAALAGEVEAVVAAPQTERSIAAAGIAFDGYPSFVARETGTPVNDVYLMICFDDVRIVHATLHVSVREAVALITRERVERVIRVTDAALKKLGHRSPKIFVGGLNPHAGEEGMFGREEIDIIVPAIARAAQGRHRRLRPVRRRHHVPQERLRRLYRDAARPGPHRRQAAWPSTAPPACRSARRFCSRRSRTAARTTSPAKASPIPAP